MSTLDDNWLSLGDVDEYTPGVLVSNGDGVWFGDVHVEVGGERTVKVHYCLRSNCSGAELSHYQRVPRPPCIQKVSGT